MYLFYLYLRAVSRGRHKKQSQNDLIMARGSFLYFQRCFHNQVSFLNYKFFYYMVSKYFWVVLKTQPALWRMDKTFLLSNKSSSTKEKGRRE